MQKLTEFLHIRKKIQKKFKRHTIYNIENKTSRSVVIILQDYYKTINITEMMRGIHYIHSLL